MWGVSSDARVASLTAEHSEAAAAYADALSSLTATHSEAVAAHDDFRQNTHTCWVEHGAIHSKWSVAAISAETRCQTEQERCEQLEAAAVEEAATNAAAAEAVAAAHEGTLSAIRSKWNDAEGSAARLAFRRDGQPACTLSPSLSKRLLKGEGGAQQQMDSVSPTARHGGWRRSNSAASDWRLRW